MINIVSTCLINGLYEQQDDSKSLKVVTLQPPAQAARGSPNPVFSPYDFRIVSKQLEEAAVFPPSAVDAGLCIDIYHPS